MQPVSFPFVASDELMRQVDDAVKRTGAPREGFYLEPRDVFTLRDGSSECSMRLIGPDGTEVRDESGASMNLIVSVGAGLSDEEILTRKYMLP